MAWTFLNSVGTPNPVFLKPHEQRNQHLIDANIASKKEDGSKCYKYWTLKRLAYFRLGIVCLLPVWEFGVDTNSIRNLGEAPFFNLWKYCNSKGKKYEIDSV